MADMRLLTSPFTLENMDTMGCDLLTVGISKLQVRRKIFVPVLIEIGGLTIAGLREKKSIFKSITSTLKTPHTP